MLSFDAHGAIRVQTEGASMIKDARICRPCRQFRRIFEDGPCWNRMESRRRRDNFPWTWRMENRMKPTTDAAMHARMVRSTRPRTTICGATTILAATWMAAARDGKRYQRSSSHPVRRTSELENGCHHLDCIGKFSRRINRIRKVCEDAAA